MNPWLAMKSATRVASTANLLVSRGSVWDVHVLYLECFDVLGDDLCGGVDGLGTVDTHKMNQRPVPR